MRIPLLALLTLLLIGRGAAAQLVAAKDASPIGTWQGKSVCVAREAACTDEAVVYRIALKGANDSLRVDARRLIDGREENMGALACALNAARAFITCVVPDGKWRFGVRHDSLVGQLRLRDGTWFRDVRAVRSADTSS